MSTPDRLNNLPIKVRSIVLEGHERTSPKLIEQELDRVGRARTVGELQDEINNSLLVSD